MNMRRLAAGSLALAGILPLGAAAAPSVHFREPDNGETISGNLYQSSQCEVGGSGIDRVRFYLDGRALNTEENSPYRCNLDTRDFSDGRHTLRAVAYDSRGSSRSTQIEVNIRNGSNDAAPTVSFTAPAPGGPLSGNVQGPPHCIVTGSNIARVMFYINGAWTNTDGNLDNGLGCWIDTTRYRDGAYTLKAVAYNSAGQTASATRDIVIANDSSSGDGPSVDFTQPANGATVSGNLYQSPSCEVKGSGIERVQFYVDGTALNVEQNAPYLCNFDTTKFNDGAHTLKAVATNSAGQSSTATRSIVIANDSAGGGDDGAPTVAFTAPAPGGPLSGNVQGPPNCIVTGSNIARVMFYINGAWTNTDGNLDNGLGCWMDTTKYQDGPYTLKAVAYNSAGQTASATRDIVIKNGSSDGGDRPAVSFTQPASGATVSGNLYQTPGCEVKGSGIEKVQFYLDSTALNTELNAPYLCNFDTTKFANGSHTLMAVASNSAGSTTTQVAVKIDNSSDNDGGDGDASAIDPADILNQARASVPFRDQRGYNTQVINKYIQAQDIPESGIHGSVLPNGESLRLGKQTDPRDSSRKALAFQLAPNDPITSGSHRAEIKFPENMSYDKVYWIAFRQYVDYWGALPTSDVAVMAQLHTSGSTNSLSPAVKVISKGGRFAIEARGSTASIPSHSTSRSVYSPEQPIKFNQWVDFVLKVKLNTSGKGFVQAWVDGNKVFDHTGTIGYNGTRPYMKFGYYNSTDFKTSRKVLLRSPVVITDPSGSKYTAEEVRNLIRSR